MNILYIAHTCGVAGSNKALVNLAKAMIKAGHKVYVLTRKDDGPLPTIIEEAGGRVFYAPLSLTMYPAKVFFLRWSKRLVESWLKWWWSKRLIEKYIEQYHIDIVHTNVGPMNLALKICQKKGIPHVWHQREFMDMMTVRKFFPNNKTFFKLIKEDGNFNICVTRSLLDYYHLSLDNRKNVVIYDGVFSEFECQKEKIDKKGKYLLYVGDIQFNKAPHVLLRVFPLFHKRYPDYVLKLAGRSYNDSYYEKCLNIIKENNIENYVEFLGIRDDVYTLMENASAVVVTSKFEGFGFVAAEAMMNNTIVVGNDTTGTKEQFDNGLQQCGQEIGFRYHTDEELLNGLFRAIEEDTSQMREKAKEVVYNNYTIEMNTKSIISFYNQILNDFNSNGNL